LTFVNSIGLAKHFGVLLTTAGLQSYLVMFYYRMQWLKGNITQQDVKKRTSYLQQYTLCVSGPRLSITRCHTTMSVAKAVD